MLSVEEMLLSCCSNVSFVSSGKFKNFCLWLADKFDSEAEHWIPSRDVPRMNTCECPREENQRSSGKKKTPHGLSCP